MKAQGHNIKKLIFKDITCVLTCDLVVKGQGVKVKCHMGQGQIRPATNNSLLCFVQIA